MLYSNTEYNVVYVDPSTGTAGDGSAPAAALKDLPAADSLADRTCYIIRRTNPADSCALPNGTNNSLKRILLMGMPFPSDLMYGFVPEAARSAWGSDSHKYANIKATSGSQSFTANNLETLLLHRVNLFRSGVSGVSAYMLVSYQTNESKGVFSFDHCRFAVDGHPVDEEDYSGGIYAENAMSGYVRLGQVRMLNIRDCVFNLRTVNRYNGVYCYAPDCLAFTGNRINVLARGNMDYGYDQFLLSDSQRGQIEAVISGIAVKYLVNGSGSRYFDRVLGVNYYPSARVNGITVSMGDLATDTHPDSLSFTGSLLHVSGAGDYSVKDITADLPYAWLFESPFIYIYGNLCNTGAGCEKEVSGISVTAGGDNAVGGCRSYDDVRSFRDSQVLLCIQNYSGDRSSYYPKVTDVKALNLKYPRGNALHAVQCRITDAVIEGSVYLSGCMADIDSISTWFPGAALRLAACSHARVGTVTVNTANEKYPYNSDDAVIWGSDSGNGNAYVEHCNVPLCPVQLSTSAGDTHVARTCANAGENGHYTMLSRNVAADTWNVHRTGGAAACLKIRNDACNTTNTMTIGRKPFRGMVLTPSSTGRHVLRMHAAFKGYASLDELARRFIVTATADENGSPRVYTSSSDGVWKDDPGAVWENDTGLTQKVLEIPMDIASLTAVDVRIHFGWYSATGFVYVDPAMELTALE